MARMSDAKRAGMSLEELKEFLASYFEQSSIEPLEIGGLGARARVAVNANHLRPGGTVSGPTLMALADAAMYYAILAEIGPVALAVTTSLQIDFLRKPAADTDVVAECRITKLGRRLAVGIVELRSEGQSELVAQSSVTYSIPPR